MVNMFSNTKTFVFPFLLVSLFLGSRGSRVEDAVEASRKSDSPPPSSLWELMKTNFYKGYKPGARSGSDSVTHIASGLSSSKETKSNSISPSTPKLSSTLRWASTGEWGRRKGDGGNGTLDRSVRGLFSPSVSANLGWETARFMGSLLGSRWLKQDLLTPTAAAPGTGTTRHGASSGWGWSSPPTTRNQNQIHIGDDLLERWLNAKLSIIRNLLRLQLRLYKGMITSTIPATVTFKLRVVDALLAQLAKNDLGLVLRTMRTMNRAILRGKLNIICALLGITDPFRASPEQQQQQQQQPKAPSSSSTYGVPDYEGRTPSQEYGAPTTEGYEEGTPSPPTLSQQYGYPLAESPRPDYAFDILKLKAPPLGSPSSRPLSTSGGYGSGGGWHYGEEYPTLPPVVTPQPQPPQDAVLIPSDVLRQLLQQTRQHVPSPTLSSNSNLFKGELRGESHVQVTRSTPTPPSTTNPNRFSSILLQQTGFR